MESQVEVRHPNCGIVQKLGFLNLEFQKLYMVVYGGGVCGVLETGSC